MPLRHSGALVVSNNSLGVAFWPLPRLLLVCTNVYALASLAYTRLPRQVCQWSHDTVLVSWPCTSQGLPCVQCAASPGVPLCALRCIAFDTLCCVVRLLHGQASREACFISAEIFFNSGRLCWLIHLLYSKPRPITQNRRQMRPFPLGDRRVAGQSAWLPAGFQPCRPHSRASSLWR